MWNLWFRFKSMFISNTLDLNGLTSVVIGTKVTLLLLGGSRVTGKVIMTKDSSTVIVLDIGDSKFGFYASVQGVELKRKKKAE